MRKVYLNFGNHFLSWFQAILVAIVLLTEAKDETKSRGKRQQISFHPKRGARPPPYAVQMEPIVQYSQRDPLYNPLAISKSDNGLYEESPFSYYPSEPEPIIEIIIKESNESLPAPPPLVQPLPSRPTKEPIQVFYVKYEKKKGYGESKSQVVYDAPIPALTPVKEHEVVEDSTPYHKEPIQPVTPPPTEPSTTLRAIIRPDSEVYHAPGATGLRVTFGSEELPPNNQHKRSDQEPPIHRANVQPTSLPPPGSSKRPHGPYQPLHPVPQRVPPAFPQQRIVNSFPPQQLLQQNQQLPPNQQFPSNFPAQQFQIPPQIRTPTQRPQRQPITIQGLPEVQQRVPFNTGSPHRVNVNHSQQPGFPGISHQNAPLSGQQHLLNHGNFNPDHQQQVQNHKQQEELKQKYYEQRRYQESLKQREQQRLAEQQRLLDQQKIAEKQEQQKLAEQQRQQEQQKFLDQQQFLEQQRQQELQSLQEQQRRKQEQEQQRRKQEQELLQEEQYRQQLKYNQAQQLHQNPQIQEQSPQKTPGEIFKAVPKLEQHYAIRENPLYPGPFPPNPQFHENSQSQHLLQRPSNIGETRTQQSQQRQQEQQSQQRQQEQQSQQRQQEQQQNHQQHEQFPNHKPSYQQVNQQFHYQNPQTTQQRVQSTPNQSIWGRPAFQGSSNHKIYATPLTPPQNNFPSSTPRSTPVPTTTSTPSTTEPTTTLSPKKEAKIQENFANLPDEVPEDIRQQLLSSGILGNADIQILDYDKIGDIPIENLPPEALENFYGAGGAAATAASEPVPTIAKKPKTAEEPLPKKVAPTEIEQATLKPGGVEMKVVRFDPNTTQGQTIADQHIREDATHLNPVTVGATDDPQYNRYLPLKVSGASFPIPDVPELSGKKISSVVVLAPVYYNSEDDDDDDDSRTGKKISDVQAIKFLAGESLKHLVKKPTAENYEKWLEQEQRTEPQKQSVVLLVTT